MDVILEDVLKRIGVVGRRDAMRGIHYGRHFYATLWVCIHVCVIGVGER
jgi:hypothetical protein